MAEQSPLHRIFSGSSWGIVAKVLDAGAKFVTIPMLVGYYGKADYALVALAFSLNAYLRLMDMGMNVGSVRYFAMWEAQSKYLKISRAARSSMVFYGLIGIVNALIFAAMANYGDYFFNLSENQLPTYRLMMYILAASTVFNWLSNVVVQLLSAKDEMGYVNKVTIISSVLNYLIALAAIKFKLSLPVYFLYYTLSLLIVLPFYIFKLKVYPLSLIKLLAPKWDAMAFKQIINYSLAIFAMGLFQFSANQLRPLLLAKFASGIDVLTDYRVIQTIAMLIMSFGAIFLQVLLPTAAKAHAENNPAKLEKMIFDSTKYISVFLTFVVFILIANANNLLLLYMGKGYEHLSVWLIIWLVTVLLSMHNTPVASLALSSGKIKSLIYSSAISCIISLPVTIFLASEWGVGAAVIGYLVYMIIQIGFFYFYYTPNVLHLNSGKIFFKAFAPTTLGACLALVPAYYVNAYFKTTNAFLAVAITSLVFVVVFSAFHLLFVIKPAELYLMRDKLMKKSRTND